MNWKDISGIVGKFAPLVGTAIGGPAGGTIGALVANALGVEEKPDAVAEALKTDPEAAVKLRQFELDNEKDIRKHAFDVLSVELKDKQDARKNHADSNVPAILVYMLTALVAGAGYLIFFTAIPEGNETVSNILFGSLLAKWGDSVAYWVGTSRGSAIKNFWAKAP